MLNLDPYGDSAFIDSSLKDVSDFVKIFEPPANSPVNSLAKQTMTLLPSKLEESPVTPDLLLSSSRHSPKTCRKDQGLTVTVLIR